ncbi:unnamed protein product [Amoebophrya sp. A25]|nr:unnamed protein product [Amoebophrya sp. A25]|eukprot:GSA25T00010867001.1
MGREVVTSGAGVQETPLLDSAAVVLEDVAADGGEEEEAAPLTRLSAMLDRIRLQQANDGCSSSSSHIRGAPDQNGAGGSGVPPDGGSDGVEQLTEGRDTTIGKRASQTPRTEYGRNGKTKLQVRRSWADVPNILLRHSDGSAPQDPHLPSLARIPSGEDEALEGAIDEDDEGSPRSPRSGQEGAVGKDGTGDSTTKEDLKTQNTVTSSGEGVAGGEGKQVAVVDGVGEGAPRRTSVNKKTGEASTTSTIASPRQPKTANRGVTPKKNNQNRGCMTAINPLAPPAITFRPPSRVHGSAQARKLTLASHRGMGLKLAPERTESMAAIFGEDNLGPTASPSGVPRERFLEFCNAADACSVYFDGQYIRLADQPTLALEVRMYRTWSEFELEEGCARAEGRSARPFYRDPQKYKFGTEIQVFYHHRNANQKFALNADGTLSPVLRPDLCIGTFRSATDTYDLDFETEDHSLTSPRARDTPRDGQGSELSNRGKNDGGKGKAPGGTNAAGGANIKDMTRNNAKVLRKSTQSFEIQSNAGDQMRREQRDSLNMLSNLTHEEVHAHTRQDMGFLQRASIIRNREYSSANKLFLVRTRSPLERREEEDSFTRLHFLDVLDMPATGLREVAPEAAATTKVQLFTAQGVPLVIMQKVLGDMVYMGKSLRDVRNVEMVEMLDSLAIRRAKTNYGWMSPPELSFRSGRENSNRSGNHKKDFLDDEELDCLETASSSSWDFAQNLFAKGGDYDPRQELAREYKFSDSEMLEALGRKRTFGPGGARAMFHRSQRAEDRLKNLAKHRNESHGHNTNALREVVFGTAPEKGGDSGAADHHHFLPATTSTRSALNDSGETGVDIRKMSTPGGAGAGVNWFSNSRGGARGDSSTGAAGAAAGKNKKLQLSTVATRVSRTMVMPLARMMAALGASVDEEEDADSTSGEQNGGSRQMAPFEEFLFIMPPDHTEFYFAGLDYVSQIDTVTLKDMEMTRFESLMRRYDLNFMETLQLAENPWRYILGDLSPVASGGNTNMLVTGAAGGDNTTTPRSPGASGRGLLGPGDALLPRIPEDGATAGADVAPQEYLAIIPGGGSGTFSRGNSGAGNVATREDSTRSLASSAGGRSVGSGGSVLLREAMKESDWYLAAQWHTDSKSGKVIQNRFWKPLEVYFSAKRRTLRLASAPAMAVDCEDSLAALAHCAVPIGCKYCSGSEKSQRFVVNMDGTISPLRRRDLVWGFSRTGKIILVPALDVERRLHIQLPDSIPVDETIGLQGPERIFPFELASHKGWGITLKQGMGGKVLGNADQSFSVKPVPTQSPEGVLDIFFDGPYIRLVSNPHAALCYRGSDHDIEFSAISNYMDHDLVKRYRWTLHPNFVITPEAHPGNCLGVAINMRRMLLLDTEMLSFEHYAKGKHPLLLRVRGQNFEYVQWEVESTMLHAQRRVEHRNPSCLVRGIDVRVLLFSQDWTKRVTLNQFGELVIQPREVEDKLEPSGKGFFWQAGRIHGVANLQEVWSAESKDGMALRAGDKIVLEREEATESFRNGKCWDLLYDADAAASSSTAKKELTGRAALAVKNNTEPGTQVQAIGDKDRERPFQRWKLNDDCTVSPESYPKLAIGYDKHGFCLLVEHDKAAKPHDSKSVQAPHGTVLRFRVEILDVDSLAQGSEQSILQQLIDEEEKAEEALQQRVNQDVEDFLPLSSQVEEQDQVERLIEGEEDEAVAAEEDVSNSKEVVPDCPDESSGAAYIPTAEHHPEVPGEDEGVAGPGGASTQLRTRGVAALGGRQAAAAASKKKKDAQAVAKNGGRGTSPQMNKNTGEDGANGTSAKQRRKSQAQKGETATSRFKSAFRRQLVALTGGNMKAKLKRTLSRTLFRCNLNSQFDAQAFMAALSTTEEGSDFVMTTEEGAAEDGAATATATTTGENNKVDGTRTVTTGSEDQPPALKKNASFATQLSRQGTTPMLERGNTKTITTGDVIEDHGKNTMKFFDNAQKLTSAGERIVRMQHAVKMIQQAKMTKGDEPLVNDV